MSSIICTIFAICFLAIQGQCASLEKRAIATSTSDYSASSASATQEAMESVATVPGVPAVVPGGPVVPGVYDPIHRPCCDHVDGIVGPTGPLVPPYDDAVYPADLYDEYYPYDPVLGNPAYVNPLRPYPGPMQKISSSSSSSMQQSENRAMSQTIIS